MFVKFCVKGVCCDGCMVLRLGGMSTSEVSVRDVVGFVSVWLFCGGCSCGMSVSCNMGVVVCVLVVLSPKSKECARPAFRLSWYCSSGGVLTNPEVFCVSVNWPVMKEECVSSLKFMMKWFRHFPFPFPFPFPLPLKDVRGK